MCTRADAIVVAGDLCVCMWAVAIVVVVLYCL